MKEISLFDLGLTWKKNNSELESFNIKEEQTIIADDSDKLFPFDDDEDNEPEIKKKSRPDKVKIIIEDGHRYSESFQNGAEHTSVSFNARTYGGASPCDNNEEIISSINHYKEWIKKEGDVAIVEDRRQCNNLIQHLGGN